MRAEALPIAKLRVRGLGRALIRRLHAGDATLPVIPLSRALNAPDGALVTVVVRPETPDCARELCASIHFVPLEESVILADPERQALEVVTEFHAKHHAELAATLGGETALAFTAKPAPFIIGYDVNRARLVVSVYVSWRMSRGDVLSRSRRTARGDGGSSSRLPTGLTGNADNPRIVHVPANASRLPPAARFRIDRNGGDAGR